ncbi:CRAL/TRIO domain-containing protein [Russula earlei]|uniref:CRAL/TRIO domain-containing protein n=1 Tax=Russula earlei TaxID=71964 RepID=A0ACC0UKR4_9AGAM|nr:CRAL/TRIO domain-containing protein [Russula earlei]
MREKVLEHFRNESYELPGVRDESGGGLREEEKFWLSNDCMLRYLRATKWNSAKAAIERLEGTLRWRREFGMYDLTPEQLEPEAVTGKEIVFGYDTLRRPALYMIPSRQNTEESPRQIQFAIWMLERALDLTGPGVESVVLMINFADKAKNPSFATAKTVLNIFQTHYPERLAASLILNVPFLIHAFFKIISPFIDPTTLKKLKFNPKPVEDGLFAADELVKDGGWGGSREFVWDHEKYWGPFVRMCDEIRARQLARWRELGARVGCDEWDYKSTEVGKVTPAPAVDEVEAKEDATEQVGDAGEDPLASLQDQDGPRASAERSASDPDYVVPESGDAAKGEDEGNENKSEMIVTATAI